MGKDDLKHILNILNTIYVREPVIQHSWEKSRPKEERRKKIEEKQIKGGMQEEGICGNVI